MQHALSFGFSSQGPPGRCMRREIPPQSQPCWGTKNSPTPRKSFAIPMYSPTPCPSQLRFPNTKLLNGRQCLPNRGSEFFGWLVRRPTVKISQGNDSWDGAGVSFLKREKKDNVLDEDKWSSGWWGLGGMKASPGLLMPPS